MVRLLLFFFCIFLSSLQAKTCCSNVSRGAIDNEVVIKGIKLVEFNADIKKVDRSEGIQIFIEEEKLCPLYGKLPKFLCEEINSQTIQDIKEEIITFLHENCIFATVAIPQQEATDGIVIFEILFSKAGEVFYQDPKWFAISLISKPLGVQKGKPIDQDHILNTLSFLNRNPFRRTEMVLSRSTEEGKTDIEFLTQDRFPVRIFAGVDNTGTVTTDKIRLFAGTTWGNAFFRGDLLTYQYSASPDFYQFQSHLVSYNAYLPWQDIFWVYGTYGKVHPDIPSFQNEGKSAQISGRYQFLQKPLYHRYRSYWELGFDLKYLNNNLFFSSNAFFLPIVDQSVVVSQFQTAYSMRYYRDRHQVTFKTQLFASLWKNFFPHQSTADYRAQRANSDVRYVYANSNLGYRYQMPHDFVIAFVLRGQIASAALLSSEQVSLGGVNSVRGYEQSQFLADNAFISNVELHFPSVQLSKWLDDQLIFYAFWDFAYGDNKHTSNPDIDNQLLIGVGPGVRYNIVPYLQFKGDYGIKLRTIPGGSHFGRFYFSLIVSY